MPTINQLVRKERKKVLEKSKMCYRPTEDIMSGTYVIDEYDFEISKLETIKKAREVLDTLKL